MGGVPLTATVAVPAWLLVLLLALSGWLLLDRLLVPSARWFLRSRANRVLEQVNERLNIRVQPFKLTRRQALVDLLAFDTKVVEAAKQHAEATGMPREAAMAQAERYAREIVPAFNAYVYFRLGYWLARRLARTLYRVRLGHVDPGALGSVPDNATIVFVMNHRSNMDYVLVAFLAAERVALSYAVGEWARVWPLQALVRSMGAYFIRRNSQSPLYRRVLERYVRLATDNGVAQAVFPEGGLTRDGALRPPRMGLLDYMLRGFDPGGERDIVFIPVALNYDRVLEDRTLLAELDKEAPRPGRWAALSRTAGFLKRQAGLAFKGRWQRFGYACVNVGAPVSARRWALGEGVDFRKLDNEARFAAVERLARHLMGRIGAVVPVLPVPLLATVLLRAEGPLSALDLKARAAELIATLEAAGARLYLPRRTRDHALDLALRQLLTRHLALSDDGTAEGLVSANPAERPVLTYYANSIAHLLGAGEGGQTCFDPTSRQT